MAISRCPGQDKRFWRSEDVFEAPCPECGHAIEFWKDEPSRRCRGCGKTVPNPKMDLGCAKWCKFAKDCFGVALPGSDVSLREALVREMERTFSGEEEHISHSKQVLGFAEKILAEEGGDPLVVTAAAILHDIGIRQAQARHGSSAGEFQEMEGPPVARAILQKLGVDPARVEHVCDIVGNHHTPGGMDSLEFRIIRDADQLAGAGEAARGKGPDELETYINWAYRTDTGRALAREKLARR